jgi:hypothetical protein
MYPSFQMIEFGRLTRRVERTGGSRLTQAVVESHRRLPPVAHPERYAWA